MGVLAEEYMPADLAHAYADGGAAAISVLTHMAGFGGRIEHVRAVRAATDLPILRKDFVTDPYEVAEARACGADAVLLIVAALDQETLARLYDEARGLDLDCIVEVHKEEELETALTVDAEVIGINNRNLEDFTVDLQTTFELITDVPAGKTVVSESGISDRSTLEELERVGVDAVLIGEALMRADDPAAKIRELTADEEGTREHFL
jgi:indole-3-glycerol phosphate synthase